MSNSDRTWCDTCCPDSNTTVCTSISPTSTECRALIASCYTGNASVIMQNCITSVPEDQVYNSARSFTRGGRCRTRANEG